MKFERIQLLVEPRQLAHLPHHRSQPVVRPLFQGLQQGCQITLGASSPRFQQEPHTRTLATH